MVAWRRLIASGSAPPVAAYRADADDCVPESTRALLDALESIDIDDVATTHGCGTPRSSETTDDDDHDDDDNRHADDNDDDDRRPHARARAAKRPSAATSASASQTSAPQAVPSTLTSTLTSTVPSTAPQSVTSSSAPAPSVSVAEGGERLSDADADDERGASAASEPAPAPQHEVSAASLFPMYFQLDLPDIVRRALNHIIAPGECLFVDELLFPRDALRVLPLQSNKHDCVGCAVLYRGSFADDSTWLAQASPQQRD